MLPTFTIGLPEGLEAALIVGIIAAFLGHQGRREALRQVWIGTAIAVAICLALGITLEIVSSELPEPYPVRIEVVAWLTYVLPMTAFVVWPKRRDPATVRSAALAASATMPTMLSDRSTTFTRSTHP